MQDVVAAVTATQKADVVPQPSVNPTMALASPVLLQVVATVTDQAVAAPVPAVAEVQVVNPAVAQPAAAAPPPRIPVAAQGPAAAAIPVSVPAVAAQAGVQQQLAGVPGKADQGPTKKKKEDKMACFRCKKLGHFINDCTAPFCDLCESVNHDASSCHLLHASKPVAIMHGYANEALTFFELPCGAFKPKVENAKLGKVIVAGDAMPIPKIIEYLKKIVPYEKFVWEVFHYRDNIYRVKFPSKQEVLRLKNFGLYTCPWRNSDLIFDVWSTTEEPLYMLPEVWVRVSGLPVDLRSDYLSLWGLGTLFGKTLDVDMAFTRKNKLLRTKIGCLDHTLIPPEYDVFIRNGFFKLKMEVEKVMVTQDENMVDATNGQDGNGGDGNANNGEGNNNGQHAMDLDPKEDGATSNGNEMTNGEVNGGANGENEQPVETIQIGSIVDPISPKCTISNPTFLIKIMILISLLCMLKLMG